MWFSKYGIQNSTQAKSNQYFRTNLENLTDIILPEGIELLTNYDQSPLLRITGFEELLNMGYALKVA